MKKLLAILLCMAMLCTASFALAEPLTGELTAMAAPSRLKSPWTATKLQP